MRCSTFLPRGPDRVCAFTIVCVLVAIPSLAAAGFVGAWEESFENGCQWPMETYTRGDELCVTNGLSDVACDTPNHYLYGRSLDRSGGAGYRALSPTFAEMGVPTQNPYEIQFRYQIPRNEACWTYALASKHVSLVVLRCDTAGNALLGLVEDLDQSAKPLVWVRRGEWHDVRVRVQPRSDGTAELTVGIDDFVAEGLERRHASEFERLVFQDLPFRIVDATHPLFEPSCFGSGAWDDIRVLAWTPDDDRPRDLDIHVEPNPTNPATSVRFALVDAAAVRIDVFDVAGRRVRSLFDGRLDPGPHSIPWNGRDDRGAAVASGAYVVRTTVGRDAHTIRVTLVR